MKTKMKIESGCSIRSYFNEVIKSMRKCSRRFLKLFFIMTVSYMPFYAVLQKTVSHAADPSQAEPSKESTHQEIKRDRRLYVFASFQKISRLP